MLKLGAVYRVAFVTEPERHTGRVGLELHDLPHPYGGQWFVGRFRKITPDKHEACEEEFVTLLKRTPRPAEVDAHRLHVEAMKAREAY